ncbi:MAG TPA: hypothetical protein VF398_05055, partial [bacterium]
MAVYAFVNHELADKLLHARAGELIPVTLILQHQADFAGLYPQVASLAKPLRRAKVISELKAIARAAQNSLLTDLRDLEKTGL